MGQPAYRWSSADFGDAYLLNTERCETLEQTIDQLKAEISDLLNTFLV